MLFKMGNHGKLGLLLSQGSFFLGSVQVRPSESGITPPSIALISLGLSSEINLSLFMFLLVYLYFSSGTMAKLNRSSATLLHFDNYFFYATDFRT